MMKGLNLQESMLAASTALMSLGMVTVTQKPWEGLAMLAVAVVMVYLRGSMKE